MRVGGSGTHLRSHPDRLHDLLGCGAVTFGSTGMGANAVRALRNVRDSDREGTSRGVPAWAAPFRILPSPRRLTRPRHDCMMGDGGIHRNGRFVPCRYPIGSCVPVGAASGRTPRLFRAEERQCWKRRYSPCSSRRPMPRIRSPRRAKSAPGTTPPKSSLAIPPGRFWAATSTRCSRLATPWAPKCSRATVRLRSADGTGRPRGSPTSISRSARGPTGGSG